MDGVKLKQLVALSKKFDRQAQKELYDAYAPLFLAICRRYVSDPMEAEDVMIAAFYKIFTKIGSFREEGSFEGWMKRIVVNEALMFLRKSSLPQQDKAVEELAIPQHDLTENQLEEQSILALMEKLPEGYRKVFNLYVVEGYKHREIADLLKISINTSKSQLILAKKRMQELVTKHLYPTLKWEE